MLGSIVNFSFIGIVEIFPTAFIIMVLVFAFSIILRSITFTGLQFLLIVAMYVFDMAFHPVLLFVVIGIQFMLGIYLVYKYFQALERNYQLILEKTHHVPPRYTRKGPGEQKAFM